MPESPISNALQIPLSEPITIKRLVPTEDVINSVSVEWFLVTPGEERLVLKIQPQNLEIPITGEDYAPFQAAMRGPLAALITPHIRAALAALAAAQEAAHAP